MVLRLESVFFPVNMNTAHLKALAIVPKLAGFTSFCFSSLIVFTVVRDKRKRTSPYHRLLCGISIVDMSSSFWLGLSTWPIPEETGIMYAVGNDTTCRLQGFWTQAGTYEHNRIHRRQLELCWSLRAPFVSIRSHPICSHET